MTVNQLQDKFNLAKPGDVVFENENGKIIKTSSNTDFSVYFLKYKLYDTVKNPMTCANSTLIDMYIFFLTGVINER